MITYKPMLIVRRLKHGGPQAVEPGTATAGWLSHSLAPTNLPQKVCLCSLRCQELWPSHAVVLACPLHRYQL